MSAFRIKKIDTGLIDEWVFRVNDNGAIPGDDIVAQDPNELAQAVSDTQHEILKSGTYAPSVLINATEGALSRIKTIEDTFGTTTLQNAYDNGRFISVAPARPLSLGALGEIELDSSGNLKINANTYKVTNGTNDMNLSEFGAQSSNSDLIFGTTGTRTTTVQAGTDLLLNDGYLLAAVPLSETGQTALLTTAQSIVGAINEISSGFVATDLQQIYNQSAPATITTTFGGGPVNFVNGSGNANTPALIVDGGISTIDFLDADKLTIGPGATINITIDSDGSIDTIADIKTATKLISPRLENTVGDITFLDSRGSTTLSEIGESALGTVKQSLFGSINEVNSLSLQNASNLAALDVEHDLATGLHGIINTQSALGSESTSRFNIKDGGGVTKVSMNALGEITAEGLMLGVYDVVAELAANVAHRGDDGTSHSAVATHFTASNPHNTVKSLAKFGDTALSGLVTISEGAGISITRVGQDLEIATSAGNTLQSVYDAQANGILNLNTTGGKDLIFRDSASALIMSLDDLSVTINKDISITNTGASISASSDLTVQSVIDLGLGSSSGHVNITAPAAGKVVSIEGVDFSDGSVSPALDPFLAQDVVGGMNDLAQNHYSMIKNATGVLAPKGTAVILRDDNKFWIPYPDVLEAGAALQTPVGADLYWRGFGVTDEAIPAGATGRVRTSGIMQANIGKMDALTGWRPGDEMYIARVGYAEAEIVSINLLNNNDAITLDTATAAKVFTAKSPAMPTNPANGEFQISNDSDPNAASDITRNNLIATLNNETYMAAGNKFYIRAFLGGDVSTARVAVTGIGAVSDTFVLTPGASIPGAAITLTSVANGTTPSWLQYELGTSASETARNLAEAINRTSSFDGPDFTIAGDGHNCKATAYGTEVEVKWAGPGKMGNSLALSTTSVAIVTPASLSGGTSKIHIFRSERAANGILCTELNAAGMTCSNFTDDEGTSQYINHMKFFTTDRKRKDDDRRIKLGQIISWADPVATFVVQPEAPRKNRRSVKGMYHDTEY